MSFRRAPASTANPRDSWFHRSLRENRMPVVLARGGGLREKAGRAVWCVVADCVKKRVGQCGAWWWIA
jgi:hypothetical protein